MKFVNTITALTGKVRSSHFIQPSNPIYKILRFIGKLLVKIASKDEWVEVNIGGQGIFKFHHQFAFSGFEEWGTSHNSGFKKCIALCREKNTFFDIGAHIGLYSLPMSRVLQRDGMIYAFEPSEKNCYFLKKHLEYNSIHNIKLYSLLVGEEAKEDIPFYEDQDVDGMNSIVLPKNPELYTLILKKQTTLDDFCDQHKVIPQVMKVDVEGAEISVLKGGRNVLKRFHPQIILSVHPRQLQQLGDSVDSLADLIKSLGYEINDIDGNPVHERLEFKEYYLC
jgi:FkbM family methyltransferase